MGLYLSTFFITNNEKNKDKDKEKDKKKENTKVNKNETTTKIKLNRTYENNSPIYELAQFPSGNSYN